MDPIPRVRPAVTNEQTVMMGRWLKHEFDIARMEVQHRPNSYEYSDSLNLGGGEPYRPASFLQPNAEPQGVVAGGSSEVSNAVPPQNEQDAIEDYSYSYESVEYDSEPSQSDNSMSLDEEVAPANIEEGSDQDTEELVVMENNSLENQASEEEISAIQMAEANNSDESRRSRLLPQLLLSPSIELPANSVASQLAAKKFSGTMKRQITMSENSESGPAAKKRNTPASTATTAATQL